MKYDSLIREMLIAIPEIKPFYDKELEWWGEENPGPHNIFGDVLNPQCVQLLRNDGEEQTLRNIFNFFEKMALCNDILVQEVLGCTVLEYLGDNKVILERAKKYMGEATMKMSDEIESGLGRM